MEREKDFLEGTPEEPTAGTPSPRKSGVESNGDGGCALADANEDLLTVLSLGRAYFERQGLNHMDAEDLASETCLRWLTQWRLGRPACRAWLHLVKRNLLVDHFRRRARGELLIASFAVELRSAAEENHRPGELCGETLADLPPADRDLLLGHYVEGLRVKELAGRLELSVDCVKQRLHRARQRLHSRLRPGPLRRARQSR